MTGNEESRKMASACVELFRDEPTTHAARVGEPERAILFVSLIGEYLATIFIRIMISYFVPVCHVHMATFDRSID